METHFDVLILGTGLTQSITAAALSKAGHTVAHIDLENYYGGDQASLTQEELIDWYKKRPSQNNFISSAELLPFSRSYSISLAPALIPSVGPLIDTIVGSGVSRYGRFKLLDASFVYDSSQTLAFRRVPGSKEDIFRARDISLIDKRKLMRFLQFALSNFENKQEIGENEGTAFDTFLKDKFDLDTISREGIVYALAHCQSGTEPTLSSITRLRDYLRSAGKYGNSPFLIGHYGGLGELAQGFCRACAVNGGVYILGHKILSLKLPDESRSSPAAIELEGVPDTLTADIVIADQRHLLHADTGRPISSEEPVPQCAYAIAILNRPIGVPVSISPEEETKGHPLDTCIVTFSPGSLPTGASAVVVRALQVGEDTLSCPSGKYILYLWTKLLPLPSSMNSSKGLLQPYLDALVQPDAVEFSCFYTIDDVVDGSISGNLLTSSRTLLVPQLPPSWTEMGDVSARSAESLFREVMRLKALADEDEDEVPFWPPVDRTEEDDDEF
ncbi:hypothetical protein Clacol_002014 [Clathrus columnatus]|uniref:Rab proteins geranylgeranyltransferase n=1 Tax=Clathrus columnatus TaxID=1419009 RepID=A0AAV5A4W4_9AGAM|nr:hypothetical protein Clacol_002014 [Clathrus columnatus]